MVKLKEKRIATGVTILQGEIVWTDQEKQFMLEEKSPCPGGKSPSAAVLGLLLYDSISRTSIGDLEEACYQTANLLLRHFKIIKW